MQQSMPDERRRLRIAFTGILGLDSSITWARDAAEERKAAASRDHNLLRPQRITKRAGASELAPNHAHAGVRVLDRALPPCGDARAPCPSIAIPLGTGRTPGPLPTPNLEPIEPRPPRH